MFQGRLIYIYVILGTNFILMVTCFIMALFINSLEIMTSYVVLFFTSSSHGSSSSICVSFTPV